jgi:YegS/Rv2252/BmrU family lipid kinase
MRRSSGRRRSFIALSRFLRMFRSLRHDPSSSRNVVLADSAPRIARMLIIYNPAAGRRRAQLLWRVLDVMATNGVRLDIAETRHAGHATELARQAAGRGERLLVAAGGDGTIAEVANGLIGTPSRLGVIPLGTANVLAHELGLPFAPAAVAAALAFGRTRAVWPGIADGPDGSRLFVQMLGAGFDAQVVHHMSSPLKRALGRSAYVLQSLRELIRYRFRPIEVLIDGRSTHTGSVVVTKGRFYAGTYHLAPGASPAAPDFTVALFGGCGPLAALAYGAALPFNLIPTMRGVRLIRASRVEIASQHVPTQADGDPAGRGPILVTNALAPISVVVG